MSTRSRDSELIFTIFSVRLAIGKKIYLFVFVSIFSIINSAYAHEFWISRLNVESTAQQQEYRADILVGQHFSGSALPYLDHVFKRMIHWSPTGLKEIRSRQGDRPAIHSLQMNAPGLHRLSVETMGSEARFEDLVKFADYLEAEGLSNILEQHAARGLPERDIIEIFVRNARSLVQIGPVGEKDLDAPTGMPYEIVALGNPFSDDKSTTDFELSWQRKPLANWRITAFYSPKDEVAPTTSERTILSTDNSGKVTLDTSRSGAYLLNAVRLDPSENQIAAMWKSHWASLTFDIP